NRYLLELAAGAGSEEPDPLTIRREEGEAGGRNASHRNGLELIDRADHQLRVAARHINDVRAVVRNGEIAKESLDVESLRGGRNDAEANGLQLRARRSRQRPCRDGGQQRGDGDRKSR